MQNKLMKIDKSIESEFISLVDFPKNVFGSFILVMNFINLGNVCF